MSSFAMMKKHFSGLGAFVGAFMKRFINKNIKFGKLKFSAPDFKSRELVRSLVGNIEANLMPAYH